MEYSREKIKDAVYEWVDTYVGVFNERYYEVVQNIRERMHEDRIIKPIPTLEYKKIMLQLLMKKHDFKLQVSDEELASNLLKNGMKITKYLTRNCHYDQRIDVFNTDYSQQEFLLSANPIEFVDAYNDITTCLSAEGENSRAFLQMLLSPYAYIYTGDGFRMIVLIDEERKNFYMAYMYGIYNEIAPISLAKYFKENGYSMIADPYSYFDFQGLDYVDFSSSSHYQYGIVDGGATIDKEIFFMQQLDDYKIDFCPITGIENPKQEIYSFGELTNVCECRIAYVGDVGNLKYCEHCEQYVFIEDYSENLQICNNCYYEDKHYCGRCGGFFYYDDFDFVEGLCNQCAWEQNEAKYCNECDNYYEEDDFDDEKDMCVHCVAELEENKEE